ncbi:MAG TPA: ABC transporter permease [Geminicoccaceae bacterium]|mgnify:FL=1|nr:ABC transporter permease [Geminicoccus sp.]HMU52585.1 ABC transporter permease [Geminicoccaceae bacterium]
MAVATAARRPPALLPLLLDHLVWAILAAIILVCSLTIEHFFQIGIFINIAQHATFVGLLAVGLSFCIIAGHMDLSIESVMAFGAMLAAWLTATRGSTFGMQLDTWLVLPIVLGFGALVGLVNAFLIVRLQINAFIVTLAMYIALRGLGLILTGGRAMYGLPDDFRFIASNDFLGLPLLIWVLVTTYLAFGIVLRRSRFGRYVYLVGGNPVAPFRAGIDVSKVLFQVFVLSGVLAAFAGWLLAARTNGATPNLGIGMLFEAFAAVVIGGVSLRGGVGRLSGVFAGVLLLSTIDTAINVMGLDASYMQVIRGALMLLAVLLDSAKGAVLRRYG